MPDAPERVQSCHIKGPYYPNGDTEWECVTHGVEAVLRDPSRFGTPGLRRADFACPVTAPARESS